MVFVSYAREDRALAAKLVHEMEAEGIVGILDPDLIEGDPFWRESTAQSFSRCQLMVGFITVAALSSPWVEQEQRAFERPMLLIDVGLVASRELQADRLVPRCDAVKTIRQTLRGHGNRDGRFRNPEPAVHSEKRLLRMLEEEDRLKGFRSRLVHLPRLQREVEGDFAWIGAKFLELRRIPASFGTNRGEVYVTVSPVTNAQYRSFLEVSGYSAPPTWDRASFCLDAAPVTGINWYEASAFASWCGGSLLSEADWERAARGGEPAHIYATSSGAIGAELACFDRPFGASAPELAASYPPNAAGYHGMCGNVWDWCASAWGNHRAIRGGGCMDAACFCAISSRYRNAPIDRDCCVGFRIKIELASGDNKRRRLP